MSEERNSINNNLQFQIDDLQSRLSHQEDILNTLNSIVAKQDKTISGLVQQLKLQRTKLEDVVFSQENDNEKPPHY